ncbi:MAG: HlyC/CorC family transporter [Rhodospirillales bacterium]|nr:HlyC/CorC family transporter [Alphaproteobacteria bacterium]MBL6948402.1 HlyC/CorC family transporter [Rhodospirillales bacterium]
MKDDPSTNGSPLNGSPQNGSGSGLFGWWRDFWRSRNGEDSARDVLDELIEEREDAEVPIDEDERVLLANILELRSRTIRDVMVPRADITAIGLDASLSELITILTKDNHSRLPVYGENLDDAEGMVHIKDVLPWRGRDADFSLKNIQRRILFVSPSMQVLELLLEMRATRCHMALVVDEFGGVDGLVTIEDLVEEIVGEIEDEHDLDNEPQLARNPDGSFTADARVTIDMLEDMLDCDLSETEGEDIDTLGGLVFSLAGRVPIRGELIRHDSGVEFEVLDADPRRIKCLRVLGASMSLAPEADTDANKAKDANKE